MAEKDKFANALDQNEISPALLSELDALFSDAKQERPVLSARLENAVLADALAAMPAVQHERAADRSAGSSAAGGMFRQLSEAVGGWPSLSGMAVASLAGLWVGFLPPSALTTIESLARTGLTGEIHGDVASFDGFDLAVVMSEDME